MYNYCISKKDSAIKQIKITYTNYKNETADRVIEPINIWFGSTEWHPKEQWLLKARDVARDAERDFALVNIGGFSASDTVPTSSDAGVSLQKAQLYADGGSRGNPGPSASGFVILDMENNVVKEEGVYVGVTTNNQAEYKALIFGLQAALAMGVSEIDIRMDSLLVVNQVQGVWKIKNAELMPLREEIVNLLTQFQNYSLSHVPRALNKLADAMVNQCLDSR